MRTYSSDPFAEKINIHFKLNKARTIRSKEPIPTQTHTATLPVHRRLRIGSADDRQSRKDYASYMFSHYSRYLLGAVSTLVSTQSALVVTSA